MKNDNNCNILLITRKYNIPFAYCHFFYDEFYHFHLMHDLHISLSISFSYYSYSADEGAYISAYMPALE